MICTYLCEGHDVRNVAGDSNGSSRTLLGHCGPICSRQALCPHLGVVLEGATLEEQSSMTHPGGSRSKFIVAFFVTVIVWLVLSLVQTTVVLWNSPQLCGPVENVQNFEPSSLPSSKSSRRQKNSPLRYPPGRQYSVPSVKPDLGEHRQHADAIFSMATGYDIDDHLITIGSLLDTNYTGDIVLGVQPLKECSEQLISFLEYHAAHSNLVVYAIPPCERVVPDVFKHLRCSMNYAYVNPFYENKPVSKTTNRLTGKDLAGRHQSPRKFRVS